MRNPGTIPQQAHSARVEPYAYAEGSDTQFPPWLKSAETQSCESPEESDATISTVSSEELATQAAEARERGFAAGLLQGREEGRLLERDRFGAELGDSVVRLVQQFEDERARHLKALEEEAVKLAIILAARVLRRELQLDPLLLTGAVRAAFGQIAAGTHVKLKVPAAQLPLWQEAVALIPSLPVKPELIGVETMKPGDCLLESELGSLDLGLRSQLQELEHSLLPEGGFSSQSEVHR